MDQITKKQKIFISHATPEDNLFSAWLSSKLALMGYDVWCDLDSLKGGEDWWAEIETVIRNEAAKFLFVLSKTSITKSGALKELSIADALRIKEFIIPLRIDDVSYSLLPAEIIRINSLDFSSNWKSGLDKLVAKFTEDEIPHSNKANLQLIDSIKQSLRNQHKSILSKNETYWSNWFELTLPKDIYIYTPNHFSSINLENFEYSAKAEKDYVITFACPNCFKKISPSNVFKKINVEDFLSSSTHTIHQAKIDIKETNRKVIELLNQSLQFFMKQKGLKEYVMSNTEAFYVPIIDKFPKISISKYGRKSIQLAGKSQEFNWHFAIEGSAFLRPLRAYTIGYHVVFTKDKILADTSIQHSRRRALSRSWYNKKWRDLLLGIMLWLSDEEGAEHLSIKVCEHNEIRLNISPLKFESEFGYIEPETKSDEQDTELS